MIWYVAFYRWDRKTIWTLLGHVEMFGTSGDGTWIFLNPERTGFSVEVQHIAEKVDALMAKRFQIASQILRIETAHKTTFPPIQLMTCASICGHVLGIRASTPRNLKRRLLANGAEEVLCRHRAKIQRLRLAVNAKRKWRKWNASVQRRITRGH